MMFYHENYSNIKYNWLNVEAFYVKKSSNKNNLAVISIKNIIKNKENSFSILFSHGNRSDIGTMYPILVDMATQLKVDIYAYDYSGYGESEGRPSESEIYDDIETVIEFMLSKCNLKKENIILFGISLGSAPTIKIASNIKYKDIRAVMLLSPIASGMQTAHHQLKASKEDLKEIDFFSNISLISEVSCPIFIVHGVKDKIIPVSQVEKMAKSIKKLFSWFPSQGDHNNILFTYRRKFYNKCKLFFDNVLLTKKKVENDFGIRTSKFVSFKIEESYIKDEETKDCRKNTYSSNSKSSNNILDMRKISIKSENPFQVNEVKIDDLQLLHLKTDPNIGTHKLSLGVIPQVSSNHKRVCSKKSDKSYGNNNKSYGNEEYKEKFSLFCCLPNEVNDVDEDFKNYRKLNGNN